MHERMTEILLIEDDVKLNRLVTRYLTQAGYKIIQAFTGDEGIRLAFEHKPQLIILDLMLPNISGIEVCRTIRSTYNGIICMLTAQTDDETELEGLTLGADEFLKKPIKPDILLLRIKRLLSLSNQKETSINQKLQFGQLIIDLVKYEAFLNHKLIELSQSDFKLSSYLAQNKDCIVSRNDLYLAVKGVEYDGIDRAIDTKISYLRKILGDDAQNPRRIKTIWGKGYLFVSDAWV